MTTQPTKKAARTTGAVAKKGTRSANGSAKGALTKLRRASEDDPRPLDGYAAIMTSYAALAGALGLGLRRKGFRIRAPGPMDLILYGLATEHLSRLITKDSVTAVLRAPFTRFKEAAGEGEVNEDVVGQGFSHALGELLTCPFCAAQWVATGLVAGSALAPGLTTAVVAVSAAARASDYLNLLYGLLQKAQ